MNILIAMDESENALRAVEYLAKYFTSDHRVTLFHVMVDSQAICNLSSPELTPYFLAQQAGLCTLDDKKKELVQKALEQARDVLVKAGFAEKNITLKIQSRKKGISKDIAEEAQQGYDMLAMGRRGLSGIEEFFLGGVSHKVLSLAKNISVILVK